LSNPSLRQTEADGSRIAAVNEKAPTLSDVKALPGVQIDYAEDGSWKANVSGAGARALWEAQRPWAIAEHERGLDVAARHAPVALTDGNGRTVVVKDVDAERVAKSKNLKPFGRARWGRGKTLMREYKGRLYRQNSEGTWVEV
jgi:hypothetical protein